MDRLRELYEMSLKHNLQLEKEKACLLAEAAMYRNIIAEALGATVVQQAKDNGTWG
jgi:hypothetical protein